MTVPLGEPKRDPSRSLVNESSGRSDPNLGVAPRESSGPPPFLITE